MRTSNNRWRTDGFAARVPANETQAPYYFRVLSVLNKIETGGRSDRVDGRSREEGTRARQELCYDHSSNRFEPARRHGSEKTFAPLHVRSARNSDLPAPIAAHGRPGNALVTIQGSTGNGIVVWPDC